MNQNKQEDVEEFALKVIVHPHPNPPPSRGRELIKSADKYSPSPGWRGLGGGGAELLQIIQLNIPLFLKEGLGEITKINFPISIL
jgi:hypothetical protein